MLIIHHFIFAYHFNFSTLPQIGCDLLNYKHSYYFNDEKTESKQSENSLSKITQLLGEDKNPGGAESP